MPNRNLLVLLVGLACLPVGACHRAGPAESAPPPRSVVVDVVGSAVLGERMRVVGVLSPRDEVRLSFKTGGIVESIAVEEGNVVHQGQVLARLRSTEIDAQVRQAREAADKAERDLARGRALYADEVATREQVEDLSTIAETTRAGLSAATFNARYARIEAPGDGVVLRKIVQPNELVQAGQPVLSVSSLDRGWVVRAAFADRDVVRIHRGDAARVSLDAFPGREFKASVQEVGSSADPQTGTFNVEFRVDPDGAQFASGMVAKVDMDRAPGAVSAGPVLPLTALIAANGDTAYVFVVESGDVAHRRSVRLGRGDGARVSIADGVAAGERVVTDGAAYLNDGDHVRPVPAAGASTGHGSP